MSAPGPKIPLPEGVDFLAHRSPVLAVACPSCHKRAGVWCIRPSGHKAATLHAGRAELADQIWQRHGCPTIVATKKGYAWAAEPCEDPPRARSSRPRSQEGAELKTGRMTGAELERLRGAIGLSQARLALLFGLDPRTMRRYVADELEIPRALAFALRLMVEHKVAPGDLDRDFKE